MAHLTEFTNENRFCIHLKDLLELYGHKIVPQNSDVGYSKGNGRYENGTPDLIACRMPDMGFFAFELKHYDKNGKPRQLNENQKKMRKQYIKFGIGDRYLVLWPHDYETKLTTLGFFR